MKWTARPGHVALDHNSNVALDHNSTYGGYRLEVVVNPEGGTEYYWPEDGSRVQAREMFAYLEGRVSEPRFDAEGGVKPIAQFAPGPGGITTVAKPGDKITVSKPGNKITRGWRTRVV